MVKSLDVHCAQMITAPTLIFGGNLVFGGRFGEFRQGYIPIYRIFAIWGSALGNLIVFVGVAFCRFVRPESSVTFPESLLSSEYLAR